jgi:hypothetical protein
MTCGSDSDKFALDRLHELRRKLSHVRGIRVERLNNLTLPTRLSPSSTPVSSSRMGLSTSLCATNHLLVLTASQAENIESSIHRSMLHRHAPTFMPVARIDQLEEAKPVKLNVYTADLDALLSFIYPS